MWEFGDVADHVATLCDPRGKKKGCKQGRWYRAYLAGNRSMKDKIEKGLIKAAQDDARLKRKLEEAADKEQRRKRKRAEKLELQAREQETVKGRKQRKTAFIAAKRKIHSQKNGKEGGTVLGIMNDMKRIKRKRAQLKEELRDVLTAIPTAHPLLKDVDPQAVYDAIKDGKPWYDALPSEITGEQDECV